MHAAVVREAAGLHGDSVKQIVRYSTAARAPRAPPCVPPASSVAPYNQWLTTNFALDPPVDLTTSIVIASTQSQHRAGSHLGPYGDWTIQHEQ